MALETKWLTNSTEPKRVPRMTRESTKGNGGQPVVSQAWDKKSISNVKDQSPHLNERLEIRWREVGGHILRTEKCRRRKWSFSSLTWEGQKTWCGREKVAELRRIRRCPEGCQKDVVDIAIRGHSIDITMHIHNIKIWVKWNLGELGELLCQLRADDWAEGIGDVKGGDERGGRSVTKHFQKPMYLRNVIGILDCVLL